MSHPRRRMNCPLLVGEVVLDFSHVAITFTRRPLLSGQMIAHALRIEDGHP